MEIAQPSFLEKLQNHPLNKLDIDFKYNFISESGKIDPQPGYPNKPGSKMWVNHSRAFDFVYYLASVTREVKENDIKDIHRYLTRDIEPMQRRGLSGRYRDGNVYIGNRNAPAPYLVPLLMTRFVEALGEMLKEAADFSDQEKYEAIFYMHNSFQYIHPFYDGNGRTGRLLMLLLMSILNVKPLIVPAQLNISYYNHIEEDLNARNNNNGVIEFRWIRPKNDTRSSNYIEAH